MTYSDLRFFPLHHSDDPTNHGLQTTILDPSEFSGEKTVTEATLIFKEKAGQLICYFCEFGEKGGIRQNNGVRCQHPNSLVSGRITSAISNCDKYTETEKS